MAIKVQSIRKNQDKQKQVLLKSEKLQKLLGDLADNLQKALGLMPKVTKSLQWVTEDWMVENPEKFADVIFWIKKFLESYTVKGLVTRYDMDSICHSATYGTKSIEDIIRGFNGTSLRACHQLA
jgi:predicted ATPase